VGDAPVAVHFAQSDRQPEEKPAFRWGPAERAGAAWHDGDGEGDIFAGGNCEVFYVERLRRLVVSEEQIPGFLIFIHSSRLQRRRDVEHNDVLLVMGENVGKIMPADCVRPFFDERSDLPLVRSALLGRGSYSVCLLIRFHFEIRTKAVSGRIHHCGLVNHAGDVMPFWNKK
jgi:hypothetical protein